MRVVRVDGGWVGLWRPSCGPLLLSIVMPAVIWDADQRGLHDKVAGHRAGPGLTRRSRRRALARSV